MIKRSTWIALALFGVALAGAFWYARSSRTSSPAADATPTPEPIWTFASQDVMSLKVEDLETGDFVEAHRDGTSGWALDHPAGTADVGRLEIAADTLASLVPSDSVANGDLATFGLDQPSDRVTLTLGDGSQEQLIVGQTSPTGDVVYVKLPDSGTIYFVSSYTLSNVTSMAADPPLATPTPEVTATLMELVLPTVTP